MKRKTHVLLGFLVLVVAFWQIEGSRPVTLQISDIKINIPSRDRKRLDYLFQQLVICDSFGYTLLGSKPMALGGYLTPFHGSNFALFFQSLMPHNFKIYLAWKTWKKYQDLFVGADFALWAEKSPWLEDHEVILLVNKRNMSNLMNCYAEDFYSVT